MLLRQGEGALRQTLRAGRQTCNERRCACMLLRQGEGALRQALRGGRQTHRGEQLRRGGGNVTPLEIRVM